MKLKLKLRSKLILGVLAVVFVAYSLSVYEEIRGLKEVYGKYADEIALRVGKENTTKVQREIDSLFSYSSQMANSVLNCLNSPVNERLERVKQEVYRAAVAHPEWVSVWANVELKNLDPLFDKETGRISITYFRNKGKLEYIQDTLDLVKNKRAELYAGFKASKKNILMDPYWYSYNKRDSIFETSIGSPVLIDNKFQALVGYDVELESMQGIVAKIKTLNKAKSFILSGNGSVVAATENSLRGKNLKEFLNISDDNDIAKQISKGIPFSFNVDNSITSEEYRYVIVPMVNKSANVNWAFGFAVPTSEMLGMASDTLNRLWIVAAISLLLVILVIGLLSHQITRPLVKVNVALKNLASGKVDVSNKVTVTTNDELSDISQSTNTLIDSLLSTVDFAREVGKGNLSVKFEPQSNDDVLGIALLDMKKNLEEAKRLEELRKIEDEKVNWATKGVALFGELLRHNETNLEEFSYHILSNLIDYIRADVGGLFLISEKEDGSKSIDLMACYAYDRRKYEERSLSVGEGLVGRCVQESETIFLSEIPEGYISIGSGLGKDNPRCILIVPLKLNDEVYGVIELAAFDVFERHVIDFVEKIGITIASTISTAKVNIKTKQLLEASKFQADELSAQEEEMRQNMEELIATQEESARKSKEIENLLTSLSAASYIFEYDIEGFVVTANDSVLSLLGMRRENLIGLSVRDVDTYVSANFGEFWNNLKRGIPSKVKSTIKGIGAKVVLYETFIPIADEDGKVYKIMVIAYSIDDFDKLKEQQSPQVANYKA